MQALDISSLDFIARLYSAPTLDHAFTIYDQLVQQLGFEGTLYAYIPRIYLEQKLDITPVFKVSETRNPQFMRHYQEAKFEQYDFTVSAILAGRTEPIDWWTEERKGILTPKERQVIITAREDYGIRHGISLSTMHTAYGIAGASVICSESDHSYEQLLQERLIKFKLYTELFHAHVMVNPHLNHYFVQPLLERLTDKEKQLLSYLVIGKPLKAAHLPDSTYKYSDKLLCSIRQKWGGITKIRLIYYIGILHLLDHL
jgi:hypothetical protein